MYENDDYGGDNFDAFGQENTADFTEQNKADHIYTFSRRYLSSLLLKKNHTPNDNNPSSDFDTIQHVPEVIKQGLLKMDELDYDFSYSQKSDMFRKIKGKVKTFRRACYLRMECQRCFEEDPNSKYKKRRRRWTTSAGTIEIKFKIVPLQNAFTPYEIAQLEKKPINYKKMVSFQQQIYKMQCQKCKTWGRIYFYKDSMDVIKHLFCRVVAQILKLAPPPPKRNFQEKDRPHLVKHRSDLCEACSKGACVYQLGQRTTAYAIQGSEEEEEYTYYETNKKYEYQQKTPKTNNYIYQKQEPKILYTNHQVYQKQEPKISYTNNYMYQNQKPKVLQSKSYETKKKEQKNLYGNSFKYESSASKSQSKAQKKTQPKKDQGWCALM